jgi:hypothetical protein
MASVGAANIGAHGNRRMEGAGDAGGAHLKKEKAAA